MLNINPMYKRAIDCGMVAGELSPGFWVFVSHQSGYLRSPFEGMPTKRAQVWLKQYAPPRESYETKALGGLL